MEAALRGALMENTAILASFHAKTDVPFVIDTMELVSHVNQHFTVRVASRIAAINVYHQAMK